MFYRRVLTGLKVLNFSVGREKLVPAPQLALALLVLQLHHHLLILGLVPAQVLDLTHLQRGNAVSPIIHRSQEFVIGLPQNTMHYRCEDCLCLLS